MSEYDKPEWAIVEVMGHKRLGGLCRQELKFGVVMLRVDVPAYDTYAGEVPGYTTWVNPGNLYSYTAAAEDVVLEYVKNNRPVPSSAFDMTSIARTLADKDMSKRMQALPAPEGSTSAFVNGATYRWDEAAQKLVQCRDPEDEDDDYEDVPAF